jgi:hypothetical protein
LARATVDDIAEIILLDWLEKLCTTEETLSERAIPAECSIL